MTMSIKCLKEWISTVQLPFCKQKSLKEKMESFWPKKLSHFDLKKLSHFDLKKLSYFDLKKLSRFDLKIWVTGGNKIRLDIESQTDSQYRVNWTQIFRNYILGIPGQILVPPVTQRFKSKWLHFFFEWFPFFSMKIVTWVRENNVKNILLRNEKIGK